ncbi:hypothetical protein POBR111598_09920 [Polynucleobacter brandtiae]
MPTKLAPKLILAPLVSKVTGLEKLRSLTVLMAPAVADPNVILVNPGLMKANSLTVKSRTLLELLLELSRPPKIMELPEV